ncbi:patatin-like phospholipase family protein [Paraclostridium bifermentans]|nr:patatin-like phospholipase family protein [Paraclostridium bifermentans]
MLQSVTRKKLLVLPDDLVDYGLDPMEFEISKAVRMSVSIPLYFYPVELKYDNKSCFVVDGGLLSNFPIWIFDYKL